MPCQCKGLVLCFVHLAAKEKQIHNVFRHVWGSQIMKFIIDLAKLDDCGLHVTGVTV